MRINSTQSENMDDEDQTTSINQKVPEFPSKKAPSYEINNAALSQQSSTKESTYSVPEPQILTLLAMFRQAQGHHRRELECQIIRNLVNIKRTYEGDWYMLEGQWAIRYTNYLYDNSSTLPSTLDNLPIQNKKNLMLNRDFFIVNETVWRFLQVEYTGSPELVYEARTPNNSTHSTTDRSKSADISMVSNSTPTKEKSAMIDIPLIGLKNELYFCYMHAALQCMFTVVELNEYYTHNKPKQKANKMPITSAYVELLDHMKNTQSESIKVSGLRNVSNKQFNPRLQHDSQEFLIFLLSGLEDEITMQKTKQLNVIQSLFKGLIESKIYCTNCQQSSTIQEEFMTLSLAISRAQTINQCLEDFLREERVMDYKCEKCGKRKTAIKRTKIVKMPNYLVLHLKRFKFFPKTHKLTNFIQYGTDGMFLNVKFHLQSLVIHQGSLEQGHYYSYGKRKQKWWLFNDQSVKAASKQDVLSQQAYLLFYKQL